ncbi:MAG: electron transport complex subunit RsxC [Methylococcales bacterium]|nr:electron transport complex subunit RsxC [Methylococcales bacterium]
MHSKIINFFTDKNTHQMPGGTHFDDYKSLSTDKKVASLVIPPKLIIPIQQHIGHSAIPLVNIGDHVYKGDLIAKASGKISLNIHASSSGEVVSISQQYIPHYSELAQTCIEITTDGKDEWRNEPSLTPDYMQQPIDEMLNRIHAAGITGLGGASFPTHAKLDSTQVDTLIINAAECEPYITCDDMLMRNCPCEMIGGILILVKILRVKKCLIGIEDNKPEAIHSLQRYLNKINNQCIKVIEIPTLYPSGGERQLIKILTGKSIPGKQLPSAHGIVCHNVYTAATVFKAVAYNQPFVGRIITVTGDAIKTPQNMLVLIGTPIEYIIKQAGGLLTKKSRLIMGGPMMGLLLKNDQLPVIKSTNCILVEKDQLIPSNAIKPCINCGACVDVCPIKLLPNQLHKYAKAAHQTRLNFFNLFDCIECGCCQWVCPSNIPLVQYFRYAKTEIREKNQEKLKSDNARIRHNNRIDRLELEKKERKERHDRKKLGLKKKQETSEC